MNMLLTEITFFERFIDDILRGAKTITLRNEAVSHVEAGQVLPVSTFEQGRYCCDIEIIACTPIELSELNACHAAQENMSLPQLISVLEEIYPGLEQLFLIEFRTV